MTDDERHKILTDYSLIEWLWLSGVTAEVAEEPGLAWVKAVVRSPSLPDTALKDNPITPKMPIAVPSAVLPIENFTSIQELNDYIKQWKESGLAKTASQAITDTGAERPRILVISDMPDDHEDRSGLAFSSPFNQITKKALSCLGLNDNDLYYSYLSKWRTPSRRSLTSTELALCSQILFKEIDLIAPQAILALGESVQQALSLGLTPLNTESAHKNIQYYQLYNRNILICTSQKGEFLVKNPAMKKIFWFSMIQFAEAMHLVGPAAQDAPVNNTEYNSGV